MRDKLSEFVGRLAKRTGEGRVAWESTVDDGVYLAAFPDYTVKLFTRQSRDYEDGRDVVIEIVDSEGRTLDEIDDKSISETFPPHEGFRVMDRMYRLARRRALGVESALDSLLSHLGADKAEAEAENSKITDDDVPF